MNHARKIRPRSTPFALVLGLLALLGTFGLHSHEVKANTQYFQFNTNPTTVNPLDFATSTTIIDSMYLASSGPQGGDIEIFLQGCHNPDGSSLTGDTPQFYVTAPPRQSDTIYGTSFEVPIGAQCTGYSIAGGFDADFTVNVVYHNLDVISTSSMPLTDTHFIIIAGYIIAFSSMIFIIWLFKRKI